MKLHFETKHEIVLSENGFSMSNNYNELNDLIMEYCSTNSESEYDLNYNVSADDFANLIEKLNDMLDDEFNVYCKSFKGERKRITKIFKEIYDNADKRDGYIYISWL